METDKGNRAMTLVRIRHMHEGVIQFDAGKASKEAFTAIQKWEN